MYRPQRAFITPFMILNPISTEKVNGRVVKKYPEEGYVIFTSYVTFGGTETLNNNIRSFTDTGNIETWYRPDIKSDTRLKRLSDGKVYEILGEPENIEMRNQILKFKIESLRGSNG